MIGLPRGVEVFIFDEPCDIRRSFNTLAVLNATAARERLASEQQSLIAHVMTPP